MISIHQKIAFAKSLEKTELTHEELLKLMGIFCVSHGIKDLPVKEVILLCLKFWHEKYSLRMNQKELELAFELNLSGDMERVNHYQCFSVEFFCDVLNKYLQKKAEIIAKSATPETKSQTSPNILPEMLEDIINDFAILNHPDATVTDQMPSRLSNKFGTAAKLNLLAKIVVIDINETRLTSLRETARWNLVRQLSAKKTVLQSNPNKFGAAISLGHQVARLKAGKLITQTDEDHLQYEVNTLLYTQTLQLLKPSPGQLLEDCVFVRAVREFEKLEMR